MKILKIKILWLSLGVLAIVGLVTTFVVLGRNSDASLVTGTIGPTESNDLSEYGKVVVQIRESTSEGRLIAEQTIDNPGQTNSRFQISYNPNDLEKTGDYIVSVQVYDTDNQLLFTNNSPLAINALEEPINLDIKQPARDLPPGQPVDEPVENPPTGSEEPTIVTPPEPRQMTITQPEPERPIGTQTQEQRPEVTTETTATATIKVHYDQDYNLPRDTKLTVWLQNLGQPRDSLNETIASREVLNPSGSPVAVELTYNANDSHPDNFYLILGGIYRQDGKQLMINSTFGFEMKINQIDGTDVHLIVVYPDEEKSPEELDGSISGSIRYKNSCQLPTGSKLTIQIRDVSYQDSPSPLIAEQETANPGSSPFKFELKYDSSDIKARNLYDISGKINAPDGKLLFINDTSYEVITRGNPVKVNLPLIGIGSCS